MKTSANDNKRKIIFCFASLILLSIIFSSFVSALETDLNYSTSSVVQIKSLKYEPYPVNPGEYFDFWVSVQYTKNLGSAISFELKPEFPFSLDSNESAVISYSGATYSPSIVLHYKIRVDKNAVEGTNQLKLDYTIYTINGVTYTQSFDIEVENSMTNFDAVIQDVSGSDVSIAIANVGKYAANSVVVRIPEQDSFTASTIDGQMVGNLESGDYTIVSFTLSQKMSAMTTPPSRNSSGNFQPGASETNSTLNFDVYYTDNIGVRRVVNMQLPLTLTSSNSSAFGTGNFPGRKTKSSWSAWYTVLIIAGVLLIAGFILYKKSKKAKIIFGKLNPKNWKNKKSSYVTSGNIPNWIKNAKEKEKK
jgi:hypothetical protein